MDCGAGVGVWAGEIARGGEGRRGEDREGPGAGSGRGRACVSGDVTGSGRGIVWEGDRFVRSVYPRVSCCVALIAKELGIAMACAWDRRPPR